MSSSIVLVNVFYGLVSTSLRHVVLLYMHFLYVVICLLSPCHRGTTSTSYARICSLPLDSAWEYTPVAR